MTQSSNPESSSNNATAGGGAGISLTGGAAILAPIGAFPNGVPTNALVLIPLGPGGTAVEKDIVKGPMALSMDEVWKLLGFNGPAVQVQDDQGRPIVIGLDDLLGGLEKHWEEGRDDLNRGRMFARELMKHGRFEKAEAAFSKIVAMGGDGEDWLSLGVAQLNQQKLEKAEATLRGAQNLVKNSPFPALHLAKLYREKKDAKAEREQVERALQIDANSVDAWVYLTNMLRERKDEESAIAEVSEIADLPVNAKSAAPYIALQGFYASEEGTREKAIGFAKKAVQRAPNEPLALLCLSALYGQAGKLDEVIKLLAPYEPMMLQDVRLAHNYFEALFQSRDLNRLTALLNKLAASPNREVKQFAIERSRALSQMLAQQQASLQQTAQG